VLAGLPRRRSDGAGSADTATAAAAEHDSGQYTNVPFHSFAVRVPARTVDPVDKRLSNRVRTPVFPPGRDLAWKSG